MMDYKNNNQIKVVALIPARAGSKRIPNKNIKKLEGHPLLAYTIKAALASGVFDRVIVSTESDEIRDIALDYGAEVPFLRPKELAEEHSPDIEFVIHALEELKNNDYMPECFSILRPTSPLRQPETIQRAWKKFLSEKDAHSLRAIEKCREHPAKMWKIKGSRAHPIMENPDKNDTPWHSVPYQNLPETYVQNASLEIAHTYVPLEMGSISGNEIVPFVTEGYEGFDINNLEDWLLLEYLIRNNLAKLPKIK